MSPRDRFVRLLSAIGRPWLFALALLGAVGVAFPRWDFQSPADPSAFPAGPMMAVAPANWPHPRRIGVGWAFQKGPAGFEWSVADGRLGVELWEYGLGEPGKVVAPIARPPGASADLVIVGISVWWLLGPVAAWSAFAGWRAARRDEAAPPSSDWRLVRPWVVVFAVVGVGFLASGITIPDAGGRSGVAFECEVRHTPPTSWHPRTVRAVVSHGGLNGGPKDWSRGVAIGAWWLTTTAAAISLVTLVRLLRGRRSRRPA